MSKKYIIGNSPLTFDILEQLITQDFVLELDAKAKANVQKTRDYLDNKLASSDDPIYGINTGFGSLCDVKISKNELSQLQANLVMSHACGTGDEVPEDIVKLMMILKIQSLAYGHSGVEVTTIEKLIEFFNHKISPMVFQQGSLGASGDLAPLAHLSLTLIGRGRINYKGKNRGASEVLEELNISTLSLNSKEGLALLNGTQFMSAYGVWSILKARKLSKWADTIGAISMDAFDCRPEPFNHLIHKVRPHIGQIHTSENIRNILKGSEIHEGDKIAVQDPYSFRCIPQVHGASKQFIEHVATIIETEINSVTDNPNIFPEEDLIISGGNFHGQILAISFDQLAIAVAELGNISERRTFQLVSGLRGLPAFLVSKPGLNSGFMIPQYTAASIVSQNKQLCTPASVDSIVSSNGQEDHVSMGANAATKCYKVLKNIESILAIELFNSTQALEFRRPKKSSEFIESLIEDYRTYVPFVEEDEVFHNQIVASQKFIDTKHLTFSTTIH